MHMFMRVSEHVNQASSDEAEQLVMDEEQLRLLA